MYLENCVYMHEREIGKQFIKGIFVIPFLLKLIKVDQNRLRKKKLDTN